MALRLRKYQLRVLEQLDRYLAHAAEAGAQAAFVNQTGRQYRLIPQVPDLPYVCLRVPTGGGKTILAAHAVGVAAQRYVRRDRVVCLWLVPSNVIREQTIARLRAPSDPYREALVERFGGKVCVLDLPEALYVQRGTLDGETVVMVSTLAALRVEEIEGRKIYEQHGALMHNFDGLDPALRDTLERREDGSPVESLCNVLKLRRPICIMDEAHNARTSLSFETLARFNPSCVIEFTATPETEHNPAAGHFASNVLAHVSAAELKAEDMIKLPIWLWTRPVWTDAVSDALAKRRELESIAAAERTLTGEYLRPIVLFQAQSHREGAERITADVLRQSLIQDHHVPEDQVAVATGATRELEGVDLADPTCPIRFVITVQALREGWDCPDAYVLCSVAEQTGGRAVEQLLGRVLRLPGAKRKRHDALNVSYAFVVSPGFADAATGLRDALVANGFERFEARTVVEEGPAGAPLFYATPDHPLAHRVREPPDPEQLKPLSAHGVAFDAASGTLTITEPLSHEAEERLIAAFASAEAKGDARALARQSRGEVVRPAAEGRPHDALFLPLIAIRVNSAFELFEESHVLGVEWSLAVCDHVLSEAEFPLTRVVGAEGVVDVRADGVVQVTPADQVSQQLALVQGEPGWTIATLADWLDRHIPHPDLPQNDVRLFIGRTLEHLAARGQVSTEQLARDKYRLRQAIAHKIDLHRAAQRGRVYQALLFSGDGRVGLTSEIGVFLEPAATYAPNWIYEGPFQFRRHLFPYVGELDSEGEEPACAVFLDQHPLVSCWVRNLERRENSLWLPTATDRFYADFVGRLKDGRVFAVEYKGEHIWSADDAGEKRRVGELWAQLSNGQCIFAMPRGPDWDAIDRAFRAPRSPRVC